MNLKYLLFIPVLFWIIVLGGCGGGDECDGGRPTFGNQQAEWDAQCAAPVSPSASASSK